MKITDFKNELTKKYPSVMNTKEINKSISDCIDILTPLYSISTKKECIDLLEVFYNILDNNNPESVKTEMQEFVKTFALVLTK